ncbi:imidazoleglycerol-phosphate dehydratase HisB [Haloechinothrix sp. LS1_15]|uniref:imidazoleglycerol-phosphate dehydratase HisB n=1 Tax=Haloechinothrix sp. LS1_15 TaxID=2652248 RepID=UPI00294526CF|nr:imidazoleglycerol-phosphate dehydratase HisB [Haloechinothrix sp. LS1_15]MDV6012691.1 imidazoleglycerol-phosphate dehydratase HisB [Haloechinothrix sp. LS1_15]
MGRIGKVERSTSESRIEVELDLDGTGAVEVATGVPFYDHMLTSFGVHGALDLRVHADGDVHVDAHHTVEDTAIVLGAAIREALGDKQGIRRFGDAWVPMDETLAHAAIDVSGRPYCVQLGEPERFEAFTIGGNYPFVLTKHVFESLSYHAGIALHLRVLHGRDPHHIAEAQYKAVARALRAATEADPRIGGIPSTKGAL